MVNPCPSDTNGDGDCGKCRILGCEAFTNLTRLYDLLNSIRKEAGEAHRLARAQLSDEQADVCDLIERSSHTLISEILELIYNPLEKQVRKVERVLLAEAEEISKGHPSKDARAFATKVLEQLQKKPRLWIPYEMRVLETQTGLIHIKGSDGYASLCGLASDACLGTGYKIIYGSKKGINCLACKQAIGHVRTFLHW